MDIFTKRSRRFELFDEGNLNERLIEYQTLKEKEKKWGKYGGIGSIVFGVFFTVIIISTNNFATGLFAGIIIFPMFWCIFSQMAKNLAWGFYWMEKKDVDWNFLALATATSAGMILRFKYRNFEKKIKKLERLEKKQQEQAE